MKGTTLKSVGAIVAGFILGAILSIGADIFLSSIKFLNLEPFIDNPSWKILIVIVYRFVFNVTGCYLTAKLAPYNPMKHVIIIGIIGTVLSLLASFAMWDKAVAWYNIAVIVMSIPSALIGGKLYLKNNPNEQGK